MYDVLCPSPDVTGQMVVKGLNGHVLLPGLRSIGRILPGSVNSGRKM